MGMESVEWYGWAGCGQGSLEIEQNAGFFSVEKREKASTTMEHSSSFLSSSYATVHVGRPPYSILNLLPWWWKRVHVYILYAQLRETPMRQWDYEYIPPPLPYPPRFIANIQRDKWDTKNTPEQSLTK